MKINDACRNEYTERIEKWKTSETPANVSETGNGLLNKFQHKMWKRSMSKIDAWTKPTTKSTTTRVYDLLNGQ